MREADERPFGAARDSGHVLCSRTCFNPDISDEIVLLYFTVQSGDAESQFQNVFQIIFARKTILYYLHGSISTIMIPKLIRLVVCSPCSSLSSSEVDLDCSAASPAVRTSPPFYAPVQITC